MSRITLNFSKDLIAEFFVSQFSKRNKNIILLTRNNDIGKYIFSMIKYSPIPVPQKLTSGSNSILVEIPQVHGSTHHCHFPTITRDDMIKINDYVSVIFNLKFQQYMMMGEKLGLQQKNTVDLFLRLHNLNPEKFGALKKKDYRKRQEIEKEIEKLAKTFAT